MKRIIVFLLAFVFLLSACAEAEKHGDLIGYPSGVDSENTSSDRISDETVDNSDVSDGGLSESVFYDHAVFENGQASVSVMSLAKFYNNADEEGVTDIYRYLLEQMLLSREATEEEIEEHKRYSAVSSYISNHITVSTSLSLISSISYENRIFEVFDDDCVRWNIGEETHHSVLPEGTYDEILLLLEEIEESNKMPYSYSLAARENLETELSVYYNVSDFKGFELYARLVDNELRFTLLSGTNRLKTKEEVDGYPAATLGEMREILKSYSVFDLEYCTLLTFDNVNLEKFGIDIRGLLELNRPVEATVSVGRSGATYKIKGEKAKLLYNCIRENINVAEDKSAVDYISDREIYTYDCLTVRIYDANNTQDVFGRFVIYKDNYAYWLERNPDSPHYFKLPDNAYGDIAAIIGNEIIDREISSGEIFDLADVTDIINQENNFEVIVAKLKQIKPTPDYVGGSGVTVIEYWLDELGKEKILIIYEQGEIYHIIDGVSSLIFAAADEEQQSVTAEQDIRAITDAEILARYPETDFSDFNVRVIINDEGAGSVYYDLLIGGYCSDFRYRVKFSSEKEILDFNISGQEYMEFFEKTDINDIRKAELKLDEQTKQYGQNSGYYLAIDQNGNLCLCCEVIVEYDVSDEMYGKGCCFDHDHIFFSEIICEG